MESEDNGELNYVSYGSKRYAVPADVLRDLIDDPMTLERAAALAERHAEVREDGAFGCSTCKFYDTSRFLNAQAQAGSLRESVRNLECAQDQASPCNLNQKVLDTSRELGENGERILRSDSRPGEFVLGCDFSNRRLRYTNQFEIGGKRITAWQTPCAVLDARTEYVLNRGELEEYRVDKIPDFPEVQDLLFDRKSKKVRTREPRSFLNRALLIARSYWR